MRYTMWLNVLAGLHLGAGLFLVLFCIVSCSDSEVGLLSLCFGITAAVIAYGLWFRRPWIRVGVVLVYSCLALAPPILIFLVLSTHKGEGAGFAGIVAYIIACYWAGVIPIAAIMLWSLCGRRARHVLGEVRAVRFGLTEVSVVLLIGSLMVGGIAQLSSYGVGVVILLLALSLIGIAWFVR